MSIRLMKRVQGANGQANIYWDRDMVEYVVKMVGFPEETYYYTSDWDDAVGTAEEMVASLLKEVA